MHKLQLFSEITYSEIRECHICIPRILSMLCEGNTCRIKQKEEANKREKMRDTGREQCQTCHYKGLCIRATLPGGNMKEEGQIWTFHQDWGQVGWREKNLEPRCIRNVESSEIYFVFSCGEACIIISQCLLSD